VKKRTTIGTIIIASCFTGLSVAHACGGKMMKGGNLGHHMMRAAQIDGKPGLTKDELATMMEKRKARMFARFEPKGHATSGALAPS